MKWIEKIDSIRILSGLSGPMMDKQRQWCEIPLSEIGGVEARPLTGRRYSAVALLRPDKTIERYLLYDTLDQAAEAAAEIRQAVEEWRDRQ